MCKRIVFCITILVGLALGAQSTINLHGTVSNQAGKAVANAIVTLVGQGLRDTTGADGAYTITKGNVSVLPLLIPHNRTMFVNGNFLEFSLPYPASVKVDIFDAQGTLLKREALSNAATGFYHLKLSDNTRAAKLLIIKASIDQDEMMFRCLPLHNGQYVADQLNKKGEPAMENRLAKITAITDTLKITAAGFQTKTVAITSYENQLQNISLDSSGSKNAPGPSIGCGKSFSTLKSGTYTIKSSGTNRTYIIKIPSNYDKNNPYRLIFGMHCMGCDAATMAGTTNSRTDGAYNYYGLGTLATNAILVAPQGNSDGTWQGEPDRKFFSDMVNLFKDTLCIDTTRIFSCGFSFGAMFTYALSLEFPNILRAVACYAPANYNMPQPTNNHLPLAYFQTTGTSDGTCPWVSSDASKTGGKYCLLQHIQDNRCPVPSTITTATSGKHVSTEYSGCKDGYPVKFSSFQGGHTANSTENGANWISTETWEFFTRF
jgi:poly(3-hydroxybutyrate) depolymerase